MDLLSEVLKSVSLQGARFYQAAFSVPWSFRSAGTPAVAAHFGAGTGPVICCYFLSEGRAWSELERGPRIPLDAGDIVIFPHGDAHRMGNGAPVELVDDENLAESLSSGLEISRLGGAGEVTRLVCVLMACDAHVSRVVLAGLPPLLRLNLRHHPAGEWLEKSIRFPLDHALVSTPGAQAVVAKLAEFLLVETVRRYVAAMPPGQTGWLAGARDPDVGKALGLLHREPARAWTVAELAEAVGASRTVLAERFRHFVGEPPIAYLTRWRLMLGARLLATTSQNVMEIAMQVGYDSEAAFNRAFKRSFGEPPARFRRESKSAAGRER